jgi:hypothetical protein
MQAEGAAVANSPVVPDGSMPDLSHLLAGAREDCDTYASLVLLMLGGDVWDRSEGTPGSRSDVPRWTLGPPEDGGGGIYCVWDSGEDWRDALPYPMHDPAAAWELETRELRGWDWYPSTGHRFRWHSGDDANYWIGPWHLDRKRAAVLAVLHKHAQGPFSHLIRPLLDRMTEETD